MEPEKIRFPIYRKYVGIDTWFKILSDDEFVEIKRLGEAHVKTEVATTQYPEMVLIKDMIECNEGRWEIISEKEFLEKMNHVK